MEYITINDIKNLTATSMLKDDESLNELYQDVMTTMCKAAELKELSITYIFKDHEKYLIDDLQLILKLRGFKSFIFSDDMMYIGWDD